jgi:hypothetical protein
VSLGYVKISVWYVSLSINSLGVSTEKHTASRGITGSLDVGCVEEDVEEELEEEDAELEESDDDSVDEEALAPPQLDKPKAKRTVSARLILFDMNPIIFLHKKRIFSFSVRKKI